MNKVIKISQDKLTDIKNFLEKNTNEKTNSKYSVIYKSDKITINLYHSGKILFQGKESEQWYNKVLNFLGLELGNLDKLNSTEKNKRSKLSSFLGVKRIGIDESGKGDFFGPLVIGAYCVEGTEHEKKLLELGVRDSKKISDKVIADIAHEIKKIGEYDIVIIGPKTYNNLYNKMKNLNNLLAWGHARCIENTLTKTKCSYVISDKFGNEQLIKNTLFKKGKEVELIQEHKAERDIAVACASILARDAFIKYLKKLENNYGFSLSKGASEKVIEEGKKIVKAKGKEFLKNIAKTHFKTYTKIVES